MVQGKRTKKEGAKNNDKVQRSLVITRAENEILTKLAGRITERSGARQSVSHVISMLIQQAAPKSLTAEAAKHLADSVNTPPIQRVSCNVYNELRAMLADDTNFTLGF